MSNGRSPSCNCQVTGGVDIDRDDRVRKLINTTDIPDHFFHLMIDWICRQISPDFSPAHISEAAFRNGKGGGRAYCSEQRIGVRARKEKWNGQYNLDYLVRTTAHELIHIAMFIDGNNAYGDEQVVCRKEQKIMDKFHDNDTLLNQWIATDNFKHET